MIVVVYHSASGRTKQLAEAVARGAGGTVMPVEAVDHAVLAAADAIVLGCPTYMGSASAQFKLFMDGTAAIWGLQGWRDKLCAGFTHSAAPSGDKLGTLTQLAVFAAQHGMIWVGLGLPPTYATGVAQGTNRLGSHLGAMAQSAPGAALPAGDLETCEHLGRRVAEAVTRWGRVAKIESARHPTTAYWQFPPAREARLERINLRELIARADRFEHHLIVCATIGSAQLEIVTASEPLYFGHVNISDEYALALPCGDPLVDNFPLMRTFLSDPETGADLGRYNHKVGELVLHPQGTLHWPGRLRAPYAPFEIPSGMRRTGLSLVYCASRPTASTPVDVPARPDANKAYVTAPPVMASVPVFEHAGLVARIGDTTLTIVERPDVIGPGWVVILDGSAPHFAGDLIRIPRGTSLPGDGIARALVFASDTAPPDPAPPSWHALPAAPFAPFEDAPAGDLPLALGPLAVTDAGGAVDIAIDGSSSRIPRYWLARMLFRCALHGMRLGYVETYEGFFVDDHAGEGDVVFGLRGKSAIAVPRDEARALVEALYRAVAPTGYRERLT